MSTSRIGRKPVTVPAGVQVSMQAQAIQVKGPKGTLSLILHPYVKVAIDTHEIKVSPCAKNDYHITGPGNKLYRSIVGTIRSNIYNMIHGVTKGFECKLLLVGVGYRVQAKGQVLSLSLGFSHPTDFSVLVGVTVETPTQTEILIKGMDKELVGQVGAMIRSIRPPEAYKGKGVRYYYEVIELKETKK
jgi:large subunit ribosomal protein L6